MEETITRCPECNSTNLTVVNEDFEFVYKCKDCDYSGKRILKTDRLDEQKSKLMKFVVTPNVKKEIEKAIQKKKELRQK